MKALRLLAAAVGLLCTTALAEAAVLRVAAPAAVVDIDPHGPNSVLRDTILAGRQIYDPLIEFQDGKPVGRLATKWEQVNDRTWRFTLRDGVTFHDGSKLDAEDVVATLKRQAAATGGLSRLWTLLEGVEAADAQTVVIKLKGPMGPFLRNISLLHIVPSEAAEAAGKTYGAAVRLPGTGPFKVKEFRPGQILELETNKSYWDRPPQVDGVRFLSIPEISGRITALINNEIDVTWGVPDDSVDTLKKDANIKVETAPSVIYLYSWFNSGRKPFTDARVRRALWHAIDIERVVTDLLPKTGKVARAPIASAVFGYAPNQPYSYDPKLAKQLLTEAGFPNGLKAEIKYSVNFGSSIDQVAQAFAGYWQEIGVDIKPTQLEHAVFTADFRDLKWDMMIATNPTYTEDADYTLGRLYSSPNGVNEENGYVNSKLHELLMAARAEVDQEKRAALYAQAGGIIWNEAVGIFPAELLNVYASRSIVSGLELAPTMAPRLRTVTIK